MFGILSRTSDANSGIHYKMTFEHSDLEFDGNLVDMGLTITKKNDKSVINFQSELFENLEDNVVVNT